MHCLPFTAKRRVLIGAPQTEEHWKPPDRQSGAAFQRGDVQLLAVVFEGMLFCEVDMREVSCRPVRSEDEMLTGAPRCSRILTFRSLSTPDTGRGEVLAVCEVGVRGWEEPLPGCPAGGQRPWRGGRGRLGFGSASAAPLGPGAPAQHHQRPGWLQI